MRLRLSALNSTATQTSGAYIQTLGRTVVVYYLDLLNVCAPAFSILTVGVANLVSALLSFTTDSTYL